MSVHPTAVIEPGASIGSGVSVGAYAVVGPEVELGPDVQVGSHVVLIGRTFIGSGTRIFSHACLGAEPQDLTHRGESTTLHVGERNVLREHVTVHCGTAGGGGETRIGNDNYLMNGAHVGHDGQVGSHCIISSFCGLAGHVRVDDHAVLGAYTGIHQHARVGESVMTASGAKLSKDAPPFSLVAGDRARWVGLNTVGLQRRGFPPETIRQLKRAYRVLFSGGPFEEAVAELVAQGLEGREVDAIVDFVRKSERGVCR